MARVVGVGVGLWLCSLLWLPAVRGIARWATIYLPYISAAALVASAAVHIPYSRIPTLRILRPASLSMLHVYPATTSMLQHK